MYQYDASYWDNKGSDEFQLNAENIDKVYAKLHDEESRKVFNARLQYAVDRVWHRFLHLGNQKSLAEYEFSYWYQKRNLPIIVYGTDGDGRYVAELLKILNYPVVAFCTNDPSLLGEHRHSLDGLPVLSLDEMSASKEKHVIFLASSRFTSELFTMTLFGTGIDREMVFYPLRRIWFAVHLNQYFDFFTPHENEIFVDGGSYNGQTSVDFSKWAQKGYDKIYIFEANPKCETMVRNRLAENKIENYQLIMKGTGNEETKVRFESRNKSGNRVSDTGDTEIELTTIDKELGENRVTFIKLDVEGSEFKSLVGATHVIQKWRPRLAISIYHKPKDFIELPLLILKLVPEYHLAMRHYTTFLEETVLYAWTEE